MYLLQDLVGNIGIWLRADQRGAHLRHNLNRAFATTGTPIHQQPSHTLSTRHVTDHSEVAGVVDAVILLCKTCHHQLHHLPALQAVV